MNRPRVVEPTPLAAVAVVLLVGVLLAFGQLPRLSGSSPQSAASPVAQSPAERTPAPAAGRGQDNRTAAALRVLQAWDSQRATAYAAGSPKRLGGLYTPRSQAGAADVRLLTAYRARGFRVVGMRTQLLRLDVLRADPRQWVLRVQDRLARATAIGKGSRVPLPRDQTSTRILTLQRGPSGRWQVSAVVDGRAGRPDAGRQVR